MPPLTGLDIRLYLGEVADAMEACPQRKFFAMWVVGTDKP